MLKTVESRVASNFYAHQCCGVGLHIYKTLVELQPDSSLPGCLCFATKGQLPAWTQQHSNHE